MKNAAITGAGITRRAAVQLGGLAGFALLMTSCASPEAGPKATTDSGKPRSGGSVVVAVSGDPVSLAPFGMTNITGAYDKNLVYESLVSWDEEMNVIPGLATSWEVPDEKTYIFHLREGVKFHGGEELTAEDVKYSFESQKNPPPPGTVTTFFPKIERIEVIDPLTVKFVMGQADGTVLGYCAWLRYSYICPKGMYDALNPSNAANGTGPFRVDKYVPNDHVALSKNPEYWDKGLPYVDAVTMKVLAEVQSVLTGLTSGSVDIGFVDADSAVVLAGDPNLKIEKTPTAAFRELEFTLRGKNEPWADVRVRQAINAAIDRDVIIKNVYAGEALLSSKIPPSYGDWGTPESELRSKYQVFDLDKAMSLMKDAGFEDGFDVTLQSQTVPDILQVAQVLAEQLKAINIRVIVQPLEIGVFGENNATGNFDWQVTRRGMRGDPSQYLSDFDPSTSTYQSWFEGGYANEELTALIADGLAESDTAKRHEIYLKAQDIVMTEWPLVPLVAPMQFQVTRSRVQDMAIDVDGTYRYLPKAWVAS
jgi:peptide/nickel transport system substrate-binding protein